MDKISNKTIFRHAIYSFIFVSAAGTLLHFLYDWSGQNDLIGFISSVNESTWEHMKLMFIPMLSYAIFLWLRFRKTIPSVFPAFAVAALVAVFLIPVFYYTYRETLGFDVTFLNISIFYLSTLIGCICFCLIAENRDFSRINFILFLIHVSLLVLFVYFTYSPPELGIFIAPIY